MLKFFSYISNQKKIISFALLFFILVGFFLPTTVSALAPTTTSISPNNGPAQQDRDKKEEGFWSSLINFISNFYTFIITFPLQITAWSLNYLFYFFALLSEAGLKYVLNTIVADPNWAITRVTNPETGQPTIFGSIFVEMWNIFKDWANMVIVLALIAIAIAIILRFRDYQAKTLLPVLIIVALLVNFSILFVGLIIDVSNILMQDLLVVGEISITGKISQAWNKTVQPLNALNDHLAAVKYLVYNFFFAALYALVGVTLFLFIFIFLERYILLAILFIFSPLAFAFFALPATKPLTSKWWHLFITWSFMGVAAAFFLRIGVSIMDGLTKSQGAFAVNSLEPGDLAKFMVKIVLVTGFLFAGFKIAKKSSVVATLVSDTGKAIGRVAAGAVTGAVGGFMMGGPAGAAAGALSGGVAAAKRGGPMIAKNLREEAGSRLGEFGAMVGERIGILPAGTFEQQQIQRQSQRMKKYDELASGMKIEDNLRIAKSAPRGAQALSEKAASIRSLVESGNAHLLGNTIEERAAKIKFAQSYYGPPNSETNKTMWSKAVAKDADLAIHDEVRMKELRLKNPIKTATGETEIDYGNRISNMAIRDAYAQMDDSEFKRMSNADIISLAKEKSARGSKALEVAIEKKLLNLVGSFDETAKLVERSTDNYNSHAVEDAQKLDYRYAAYDSKLKNKIVQKRGMAMTEDQAKEEARIYAAKKLDVRAIRENQSEDIIDIKLLENISSKTIGNLDKENGLSYNKRLKFTSPELKREVYKKIVQYSPSGPTPNPTLYKEWTDKIKALDALT